MMAPNKRFYGPRTPTLVDKSYSPQQARSVAEFVHLLEIDGVETLGAAKVTEANASNDTRHLKYMVAEKDRGII
jgi:hypothetical protein